ncbi:MAG: hypothetical protein M5U09_20950 [Gammaproteobacteria bacterium]|nr:hypothetical protein [Gammaproteobacteria bacterium]
MAADRESLDRAEELLRSTRAKEALGRSTRIDSLRVELQRGLARSRLAANTERLESERQALAELLGLDPDIVLALEPTGIFSIDLPPADEAVERALDNRLDYAQALQDRDDAVRGARIAENLLLPDVTPDRALRARRQAPDILRRRPQPMVRGCPGRNGPQRSGGAHRPRTGATGRGVGRAAYPRRATRNRAGGAPVHARLPRARARTSPPSNRISITPRRAWSWRAACSRPVAPTTSP